MPTTPIAEQGAHVFFTQQTQGEDAPAPLEWRSSGLNAANLAHLGRMNFSCKQHY